MGSSRVETREISDDDAPRVADFFATRLNTRVSSNRWLALLRPPWSYRGPHRGFQLLDDGRVVGAYAAVFSERELDDGAATVCNLAAFCVQEEHRAHGLRLLRTLLAQKGVEFTDLSPSGNVVSLNERLGFQRLDTATTLVPNVPAPAPRGVELTDDPARLAEALRGADARIYADHATAPAARHLLVSSGADYAYLVFRKDRRKGLRLFATPLHASGDPGLLRRAWPAVGSWLLRRHGVPLTLAEHRVIGFAPSFGRALATPRPRMYRSARLDSDRVDYLYSELTLVEW